MAVHYDNEKIEWVLGEAKSAGGKIEADDVAHMKAIADKLKGIGVIPYLVFSKTADSFSPEEIELFKTAKTETYSVILFSNKEIDPYNPYYESDDTEKLPHKYAHSFDDLVRNSEYRYLRPVDKISR
jgi:septin family protein